MPISSDQKGVIQPLAIVIVAILVIGGVVLISRNSKDDAKTSPTQKNTENVDSSASVQWETYKDEERGYSIQHPKGWTVENSQSQNSRLIKVTAGDKLAFVMIETIAGPSLEGEGAVEEVVKLMEEKLKKDTDKKITASARKSEGETSGFIAAGEYLNDGEEASEEKKIVFEERFMVAKNGRGMRVHTAYPKVMQAVNKPITSKIISSFSIN